MSKNLEIKQGDLWLVEFPFEDSLQTTNRPVIVLDVDELKVLSVKVTKHAPRTEDPFDCPIVQWQECGLKFESTARISKVLNLDKECFIFKLGTIMQTDMETIIELYIKYIESQSVTSEA